MKTDSYKLYSSPTPREQCAVWAEIDLDALRHNYRTLRAAVTDAADRAPRMITAVKAEAYGHGAERCVRALLSEGCDFFAVATLDEAIGIRKACTSVGADAEILILGYTPPTLAATLSEHDIIQTLLSADYARELAEAAAACGVAVRVHAALDTGMNRIGFPSHNEEEIQTTAEQLGKVFSCPCLQLEGAFTHFAVADSLPCDGGHTRVQSERFRAVIALLAKKGFRLPFLHVCNSAGAILSPDDRFDGVRFGIALYGSSPSKEIQLPLRSVMKLCTTVAHLHRLLPGERVGYGGTFEAGKERRIATLPIGYAHGFLRAYSGADVTVHTKSGAQRATVVGRVCMDQCMLDVTGLDVAVGDAVTLFGEDPSQLDALASRAGTIPYECLCLISSRVPRIYKD